jgi:SsrA-binding protein
MAGKPAPPKVFATNKQAHRLYEIMETVEAGIVLRGTEVKSVRAGRANMGDCYARVENGELWLHELHISPWSHGNIHNHEPLRPRKLLLHKREIARLIGKVQRQGLTLIATRLYAKGPHIKAEVALGRGKKLHDRREDMKAQDAAREIERALRERNR